MNRHMSTGFKPPKLATTYSEYIHDKIDISVVGRVKQGIGYMRELWFDYFSLKVLSTGYIIPFATMPSAIKMENNASARNQIAFVRETIDHLMAAGAIEEVNAPCHVVNPLSVAINVLSLQSSFQFSLTVLVRCWTAGTLTNISR